MTWPYARHQEQFLVYRDTVIVTTGWGVQGSRVSDGHIGRGWLRKAGWRK